MSRKGTNGISCLVIRTDWQLPKKFGTAEYPNPARAGVAYMIAPIMRTVDETNVPEPKTMNMPHNMFYAPGVRNSDLGGKPSASTRSS